MIMKKIIFGIAAVLFAVLGAGCSDDSTEAVCFPGDVTFNVLKNGRDANGAVLQFEVNSNVFWQLLPDAGADWVSASPAAADGKAVVTFTVAPNHSAVQRTAELTLRRLNGASSTLRIVQEAGDRMLCFASETFGDPAAETAVGEYAGWQTSGIGVSETLFSGEGCHVGTEIPSAGYDGATGSGNVAFTTAGSSFVMGPVDIADALDFRFSFGAFTSADAFDSDALKCYASKNGTHWAPVTYERGSATGWASAETRFYVSDDIKRIWFKFETSEAGKFRLDDLLLIEGEPGEAKLLELGGELAVPSNITGSATETTLTFNWDPVRNAAGYEYECFLKDRIVSTGTTGLNSVTVSGLEVGVAYRFRVRALPAAESIYIESPYCEPFDMQTIGYLPMPQVWLFRATHGMLVFEWTRSTQGLGRRYNLELLDAAGNVLRKYERVNYASNATYDRSYIYNRQVFGNLSPDTEYTLRVQYVSDDANYHDSEWNSCKVRTLATPILPSNCLLYKDFETAWFGGSAIDVAWGVHPKDNQMNLDYGNEEAFNLVIVYPIRCMEDSFNAGKLPDQYRRKYWSGWDWSDISKPVAEKANSGLFMICGALKFGSGSAYGRMTTSPLGEYGLSLKSDVTVSFKAAPYYEPNLTTGSLENAYIACGATFEISIWSGSGTFENGATKLTLTNLRPDETGADARTCYSWTEHSVKVYGADATTRISISTIAQKGYYRMWLDDLMIVRGEGAAPGDTTGGDSGDYGDGGDGFSRPGSGDSGGDTPGYGDGGDGFGGAGTGGDTPGYGDGGDGYGNK